MKKKQFFYWLKGFMEGKPSLTKKDMDVIKGKMDDIENPQSITSSCWTPIAR
jgi:hypothetical protein